jgi:hypothetical protein
VAGYIGSQSCGEAGIKVAVFGCKEKVKQTLRVQFVGQGRVI